MTLNQTKQTHDCHAFSIDSDWKFLKLQEVDEEFL